MRLLLLAILSTVQDVGRPYKLLDSLWETVENTFDDCWLGLLGVRNVLRDQGCGSTLEDVLTDSRNELRICNLRIRSIRVGDRRVISMGERNLPPILEIGTGARDIDRRIFSDFVIETQDNTASSISALDKVSQLLVGAVEILSSVNTQEIRPTAFHACSLTDLLRSSLEESR